MAQLPTSADTVVRVEVHTVGPGTAEVRVGLPDELALVGTAVQRSIKVHMKWISVDAGYDHSCGVTLVGAAWCWGGGSRLLGGGSNEQSSFPVEVVGAYSFAAVSAGWGHTCGTLPGGLVFCWGLNRTGALGTGSTDEQLAPTVARFSATLKHLQAAYEYTCGINLVDTGICWGDHASGQLGSATAADDCGGQRCSLSPVSVQSAGELAGDTIPRWFDLAAGDRTTCGIRLDNKAAYCWGDNAYGILGSASVSLSDSAVVVPGGSGFTSIGVGRYHACALDSGGQVYCWGSNRFGELGTEMALDVCSGLPCSLSPEPVRGLDRVGSLSVGEHTTCVLTAVGEAHCWGLSDRGQTGSDAPDVCDGLDCTRTPRAVDTETRFSTVSVGKRHVCALSNRGGAFCWGEGSDGRLGNGSNIDRGRPVRVADPS